MLSGYIAHIETTVSVHVYLSGTAKCYHLSLLYSSIAIYMLSFTESTDFIRTNSLELMMSTNSLANATVCINVTIIDKDIEVDEYFTAILVPVDPAVSITSKSDTILIPNDLIDGEKLMVYHPSFIYTLWFSCC